MFVSAGEQLKENHFSSTAVLPKTVHDIVHGAGYAEHKVLIDTFRGWGLRRWESGASGGGKEGETAAHAFQHTTRSSTSCSLFMATGAAVRSRTRRC